MEFELLPERKGFKANLHSHTVDSDGYLTAEQMKKLYMENGYSILAYTDHGYMCDRTKLNDENFVALNGYENHFEPARINGKIKNCYHLNFYAPKPDTMGMIGMTDYYYEWCCNNLKPQSERLPIEKGLIGGFMPSEFCLKNTNDLLKKAKELGYLVINNHPIWSNEIPSQYLEPDGFLGIEIANYGCMASGFEEANNGTIYDQILRSGKRQFCFANDDNHNAKGINDSFGGYNIMYPKSLTYSSVYNCMKEGKFYASTGAEICGLYVKDGVVYVGTNNALYVRFITDNSMRWIKAEKEPLKEVKFKLHGDEDYFRIVVGDLNGKNAFSRAYFREELINK